MQQFLNGLSFHVVLFARRFRQCHQVLRQFGLLTNYRRVVRYYATGERAARGTPHHQHQIFSDDARKPPTASISQSLATSYNPQLAVWGQPSHQNYYSWFHRYWFRALDIGKKYCGIYEISLLLRFFRNAAGHIKKLWHMCKNAKLVLEAAVLLLDFLLQRRLEYSSRVLQNVYFMVFFEDKVSMKHNFVYQLTLFLLDDILLRAKRVAL